MRVLLVTMTASPHEIEASDAMLAEAAKSDLVIMRHLQALVLDTTEPKALGTLVNAYTKVSRTMRQNLALLARQKAERAKAEREAAAHPRLKTPDRIAREARADELLDAVGRVISAAAGGDEVLHADWVHRFDRELDDWFEADDFLAEPLHDQVLRAARTLGLAQELAERWAELPEPTFFPDPAPDERAAIRDMLAEIRAARAAGQPAPPWLSSG